VTSADNKLFAHVTGLPTLRILYLFPVRMATHNTVESPVGVCCTRVTVRQFLQSV